MTHKVYFHALRCTFSPDPNILWTSWNLNFELKFEIYLEVEVRVEEVTKEERREESEVQVDLDQDLNQVSRYIYIYSNLCLFVCLFGGTIITSPPRPICLKFRFGNSVDERLCLKP